MATTVSQIIDAAFNDLGVTAPGESVSSTIQAAALLTLIQMWSGWSAEQAMAYLVYHQSFTLTAGQATYTVGTGGSLVSTARPIRITGWGSVSGSFRNGGPIISFEQFHAQVKNPTAKTSVLAEAVAADMLYPAINILVYPTPATSPGTLELDYYSPLTGIAAVGDNLNLPDGYEAALHYNLAVALAPQYARVGGITAELAANAKNSKAAIMAKNAAVLGLEVAPEAA